MASNRSPARARAAAPVRAETPKDALATLVRQGARIQIAALSASRRAVTGWARASNRFAHAIGEELRRCVEGETSSVELLVRVTQAANVHLSELTALPGVAADHFDTRLARVSTEHKEIP